MVTLIEINQAGKQRANLPKLQGFPISNTAQLSAHSLAKVQTKDKDKKTSGTSRKKGSSKNKAEEEEAAADEIQAVQEEPMPQEEVSPLDGQESFAEAEDALTAEEQELFEMPMDSEQ